MSKAFGKDINEFYNNHFPEGCSHEDYEFHLENFQNQDGVLGLHHAEKYELSDFGCIVPEYEDQGKVVPFQSAFKKWQKNQTHISIVLEIPNNKVDEVITTLKQFFPSVKVGK
jgi:hypothetical protein